MKKIKLPKPIKVWRNSDPETRGLANGFNLCLKQIKKLNKIYEKGKDKIRDKKTSWGIRKT